MIAIYASWIIIIQRMEKGWRLDTKHLFSFVSWLSSPKYCHNNKTPTVCYILFHYVKIGFDVTTIHTMKLLTQKTLDVRTCQMSNHQKATLPITPRKRILSLCFSSIASGIKTNCEAPRVYLQASMLSKYMYTSSLGLSYKSHFSRSTKRHFLEFVLMEPSKVKIIMDTKTSRLKLVL